MLPFQTVGIILILLVAIVLLWISNASSNGASVTSAEICAKLWESGERFGFV